MSSSDETPNSTTNPITSSEDVISNFSQRTVENSAPYVKPYLHTDSHILDLGCGPGSITANFAARCPEGRVVGVDIEASVIETAKSIFSTSEDRTSDENRKNVPEFFVADAVTSLPFEDASFDIVHGHQFAQFVTDVPAAVAEWRRVLKPGGVLALRVVWLAGVVASPPHATAFGHMAAAMNGMFLAAAGGPCVIQRSFPGAANAAGFREVDVRMDAFVMRSKEMRAEYSRFMLSDAMLTAWRKQAVISEEQIEQIREGLTAVKEAEFGFIIVPSIDAVCRV